MKVMGVEWKMGRSNAAAARRDPQAGKRLPPPRWRKLQHRTILDPCLSA
jgi:hypothetical protein